VLLLILCAIAFWWRIGRLGLIDPDEPFYAQTAREMLDRRDWLTPWIFGHPQFEKPIFFYWLEMLAFTVLGRSELAARAPSALFGTLLVIATYAFGARAFGRRVASLAALVLATSIIFSIQSRLAMTDMVFAFFVCVACFASVTALTAEARRAAWVLGFAAGGFATLTKGPIGTLIPLLAGLLFAWSSRGGSRPSARTALGGTALGLAIAGPWYVAMLDRYGWLYFRSFFIHENLTRLVVAEHPSNNHVLYYPGVILVGFIPWLPLVGVVIARLGERSPAGSIRHYLECWIASGLALFTIAQSKLPSYILFLFVPLALLLGVVLDSLLREGYRSAGERWIARGAALIQFAASLGFLAFRPLAALPLAASAVPACLAAAAVLLWRRPGAPWVAASALSTVALVACFAGWAATPIDAELSVKQVAAQIPKAAASEPLLATPMLVRGMFYYTGVPMQVWSGKERAFFTPHPLRVVVGASGLRSFVREAGPTRCVLTASRWRALAPSLPRAMVADSLLAGDKVVVRLLPDSAAAGQGGAPARPHASRAPEGVP
jgi:4-amino-4-deoxy-L-arabinose transferase-like glycosyltransferase